MAFRRAGPVSLMHGNRDLLLGERFVQATGARLLPVDRRGPHGTPTLLLHGDELCTDVAYQRFRPGSRPGDAAAHPRHALSRRAFVW
jgi:UDP-2,3-diacylglucosamine pyrophosphatase LpxH